MKITIRVLGRYKDITRKEHIELSVTEGNTLYDVVTAFVQKYPAALKDKKNMMVLKNKTHASFDTQVSESDDITLCPPVVSGG